MKTILYDVTNYCNLRCSHCYNANILEKTSDNKHSFNKVSEYINNLQEVERVHILGGEPLTYPNLKEFIDSLDSNIKISINTNGTLLTKYTEYFGFNKTIDQITVSIDGYNAELNDSIRGKGNFDIVCNEIQDFNYAMKKQQRNIGLNIAYVVTPENYKFIASLIDLSMKLNVQSILISFLYYEGNSKSLKNSYDFEEVSSNLISLLKEAYKENIEVTMDVKPIITLYWKLIFKFRNNFKNIGTNYCYALENMQYISNDNRIYPCGPSSKLLEDKCIMDLNKNKKYANTLLTENLIKNNCGDCIYTDDCSECPIGIESASKEFCIFAKKQVNNFLRKYFKNKLTCYIDLLDSELIKFNDFYYITNFTSKFNFKLGMVSNKSFHNLSLGEIFNSTFSKKDRIIVMLGIYEALEKNIIKLI